MKKILARLLDDETQIRADKKSLAQCKRETGIFMQRMAETAQRMTAAIREHGRDSWQALRACQELEGLNAGMRTLLGWHAKLQARAQQREHAVQAIRAARQLRCRSARSVRVNRHARAQHRVGVVRPTAAKSTGDPEPGPEPPGLALSTRRAP